MKKVVKTAIAAIIALSSVLSVSAKELSDWAVPAFDAANTAGLIPASIMAHKITGNITRAEFCDIAMNMYSLMNGDEVENTDCPFTDTDDINVAKAHALGVINGKTPTEFFPDSPITRQEIAKILMRTINAADKEANVTAEDLEKLCIFEDFGETDDWAAPDIAKAIKYEIINGVSKTQLLPHGFATREQAITIINRAVNVFADSTVFFAQPEITNLYNDMSVTDDLKVKWTSISGASGYSVIIKDENYEPVLLADSKKTQYSVSGAKLLYNRYYYITVGAKIDDYCEVFSSPVKIYYGTEQEVLNVLTSLSDRYNRVFPNGIPFATEEDAEYNMELITVPVWKLSQSGEKHASTAQLMVNRNLASEVVKIFTEIYRDKEQFPIKDVGAYSWRETALGGISQHSYGTCIDINYDENYYCYAQTGEAITGSFWKPFENPFSIPETGSVVRAFSKYGWTWGGNSWTNLKDYMHFSYLGK